MPDPDLKDRVAAAVRDHAAPALGLAGSDVEVVAVADGIASVRLSAACLGCGGGVHAVVTGLEQVVREHVPEVELLEAVP